MPNRYRIRAMCLAIDLALATGAMAGSEMLFDQEGRISINPNAQRGKDAVNVLVNPELSVEKKRQNDAKDRIKMKLFQGMGPEGELQDPSRILKNVRFRFDRPDGVDENGHPMTKHKRTQRRFIHDFADAYVKSYREGVRNGSIVAKPRPKSEVEIWKEKTEETKCFIEAHGPITTKRFVIPGMTEDEAARYYDASTRIRVEDGKLIPIYAYGKEIPTTKSTAQLEKEKASRQMREEVASKPIRKEVLEEKTVTRKLPGIDSMQGDYELNGGERVRPLNALEGYVPAKEEQQLDALPKPQSFNWLKGILELVGIRSANATELLKANETAYSGRFDASLERMRKESEELRRQSKEGNPSETCPYCSSSTTAPSDFNVATGEIVSHLADPDFDGSTYATLRMILSEFPEIRDHIPDVERRLESFRIGSGSELEKMAPEERKALQTVYVFVSYSMRDAALSEVLKAASGKKDTVVVMRGFPEGMTFAQGLKRYKSLVNELGLKELPAFTIDPPLFKAFGIQQIPAVVLTQNSPPGIAKEPGRRFPKAIAKVSGLSNGTWLREQVEAGFVGDLGVKGNLFEITEPDLIEVMQQKVLAIDWDQKKREAIERYWAKRDFLELPSAEKTREFIIDPTIVVSEDITDLSGHAIHRKGDLVNPLSIRPFTSTLIVFNPTKEDELARVKAYLKEYHEAKLKAPILIATQIDRNKGWDAYSDLSDAFDSHIYFLTPEVMERWRIDATPSVVWADAKDLAFHVRELGPCEKKEESNEP